MTGIDNARWEKLLVALGEKEAPKKKTTKKKTTTKVTTVKSSAKKKTNKQIAEEVIAGKWGNGDTRKKKLTEAGYNYSTIQKLVNEMLK